MQHTRQKITVVSHSGEPFSDRMEAGRLLGEKLGTMRGKPAVVFGIPRGGVVVAYAVAKELNARMDIVLSRKIGAPGNPELAIGSVGEEGAVFIDETLAGEVGASSRYIEQEKERQLQEIQRRSVLYRSVLPRVPIKDRIAILVDDGLATGATMQAAVRTMRQESARRIVVAVPVASEEALERVAVEADETICLSVPSFFMAVGQFYLEFNQVEDKELMDILRKYTLYTGEEKRP